MVRVRVRLLGTLREFSRDEAIHLRFDKEPTMEEVVQSLLSELGSALEKAIFDPLLHNPLPRTLILVNGLEIGVLLGMETMLRDGDEVVILPVSHGG